MSDDMYAFAHKKIQFIYHIYSSVNYAFLLYVKRLNCSIVS